MSFNTTPFKQHALAAAMTAALGCTAPSAMADTYQFNISGLFTMLDSTGSALDNTSLVKGTNRFQTAITGTMEYDTATGTGSMSISPFDFFAGTLPAEAVGIEIQAIGNGLGGSGNLLLSNMTFDWNGNSGIPVSLVWDATGLLNFIAGGNTTVGASVSNSGAVPASDGTYTDATWGYLGLGPVPLATTAWNTSFAAGCALGSCMGVTPSGALPLATDTVANNNDFAANTGATAGTHDNNADTFNTYYGVGGNPMADGPFQGFNANFDFTSLTLSGFIDETVPVLTLTGDAIINLNVGDAWNDPGYTCTDNVDASPAVTIGGDAVNTAAAGSYVITYTCSDGTNEVLKQRTVNVVAAGVPVITLLGDNPLSMEVAADYTDPGATCQDDEDGNIALGANFGISENTVVSNVAGSYNVTYSCTDSGANTSTATRVVEISPSATAPTVTLTPSCPIVVMGGPGEPDPTPEASAEDTLGNPLEVSRTGDTVDPNPSFGAGQLSRIYNLGFSATDASDNTTTLGCQITVGNPVPVVTLEGAANVTLTEGEGYDDPGAVCEDFNLATPETPDVLAATPDIGIDTTTPAGSYTITYSCTDGDMNTGSTTRTVVVTGEGGYSAAPTTSGSNFSMLDPEGSYVGGAPDIFSNWDGSLLASTADNTINMTMGSALPTPFFGFPWQSHSIRVFGPGSYSLTTSRGNPLSFTVGPNQIGAHMLFDWNNNDDIDVAIVWNINGAFEGDGPVSGEVFNLVSVDGDGDGFPGIRMPDGPFTGFSANFNINFTPAFTLGAVEAPVLTADQGGTTRTALTGGGNVTVTASTGNSFDWSGSSAALVSRAVDGTSSASFTFDPSTLTPGTYSLSVAIDDGAASGSLLIRVLDGSAQDVADDDNDGIPNYLDEDASGANPTALQVAPGGASLMSSGGKLELGDTAFAQGAGGAGVSMDDIISGGGIGDGGADPACIGGCFDFAVTDLPPGGTVQVVLPLSDVIPEGAVYRKLIGGAWRNFSSTGGDAVASALSLGGVCPAPASGEYAEGLVAGNDCVRLTLSDGGSNDADGLPNGIVRDPGGVAIAAAVETPVSTIGDPSLGGGCALNTERQAHQRLDLWLLAGLLGWLGLRRKQAS